LTALARTEAPALIGFARLAERHLGGLHPPGDAIPAARLLADGFVTIAAAETIEDLATLPCPTAGEVGDASASLRGWFAECRSG
jgi:hypothetical protein